MLSTCDDPSSSPAIESDTGRELEFRLQVSNRTLRHALSYVAANAGFVERKTIIDTTVVVQDSPRTSADARSRRHRILVVDPTPFASHSALRAVTAGAAMAVFLSDDPDDFLAAMEAIAADRAMIPGRLIDIASRMPELTERQLVVMAAVIAGKTNRDIARSLHFSDASIKRELAELFRSLDVTSRIALTTRGLELGITANANLG